MNIFAAILLMAGCQSAKPQATAEQTAVQRFAQAQSASGAAYDATLRRCHFDGDRLNSLGREKLDAMLRSDRAGEPMVVYLDAPEGRAAVVAYLKDRGFPESQLKLQDGPNPHAVFSAAEAQKGLAKTDTTPAPAEAPPQQDSPLSAIGNAMHSLTK
jgi:hypothetical protein